MGKTIWSGAENFAGNDLKTAEKTIWKQLKSDQKIAQKNGQKTVEKTVEKHTENSPEIRCKNKTKNAYFFMFQKFGFSQFYHNIKGVSRKLPKTLCEIIVLILWTFCENINFAK